MLLPTYNTELYNPDIQQVTDKAWWEQLIDLGKIAITRALPVEQAPQGAPGTYAGYPYRGTISGIATFPTQTTSGTFVMLGLGLVAALLVVKAVRG